MRWRGRIAAIVAGVVVVGALGLGFRILSVAGVFSEVTPGFGGACKTVKGVIGAEDIAIDHDSGLAFISATDRRAIMAGKSNAQDGIYVMKTGHPEQGVTKLDGAPADFHPHGISLLRDRDGTLTLMAVNHPLKGPAQIVIFNVVQVFLPDGTSKLMLRHVKTVSDDLLFSPNDVVAVGKDRFYATNDHGSRTDFGTTLENYLMLPRAYAVYYDGAHFSVAAKGLRYANGINVSPDLSHVYIAETIGREVKTYLRDPITGALKKVDSFDIPAGLDNIDVDDAGNLWVAGHPKLFSFLAYARDPSKPSPSEIFRVAVFDGVPHSSVAIFTSTGKEIGASSVGAVMGDQMLIGSVFDPKILSCTMEMSGPVRLD
ncbi:MAG TPA: SMP-30/gluconolactonase/LRE family protein [Rhizomicrobium sp.]|nr:SMP-30/gluconolactonase/LRE family protein [Rhizomicrobium sp.]